MTLHLSGRLAVSARRLSAGRRPLFERPCSAEPATRVPSRIRRARALLPFAPLLLLRGLITKTPRAMAAPEGASSAGPKLRPRKCLNRSSDCRDSPYFSIAAKGIFAIARIFCSSPSGSVGRNHGPPRTACGSAAMARLAWKASKAHARCFEGTSFSSTAHLGSQDGALHFIHVGGFVL